MGKVIRVLAVILIVACGVWAQQQHRPLVAVLPFEVRTGVSQQDAATITEIFINELQVQATGRIRILTRASADFARILEEMQFQRTDMASEENAAQIGRRAGAQFVISGQFSRLGQNIVWIARMVNVETGEVASSARETIKNIDEVLGKMPSFSKQIVSNLGTAPTTRPTSSHQIIGKWRAVSGSSVLVIEFQEGGRIRVERFGYLRQTGWRSKRGRLKNSDLKRWQYDADAIVGSYMLNEPNRISIFLDLTGVDWRNEARPSPLEIRFNGTYIFDSRSEFRLISSNNIRGIPCMNDLSQTNISNRWRSFSCNYISFVRVQ
ncbi:MAG: penicillin-binding protein activator LpoB [Chitinivibrionia bacterium]|nr:penicillin-binding protein activator LpoB [Chitinivibrionia bacterium]